MKDSTKLVYKQIKTKKRNQQKQENELGRCFFLPVVQTKTLRNIVGGIRKISEVVELSGENSKPVKYKLFKKLRRRKEAIFLDHASMRYQALQLSFCSQKNLSGPDINLGGRRRIIPLVNLFMRPLSTDYLVWLQKFFLGLELRCSCARHACNNSNNQLNLDQHMCWGKRFLVCQESKIFVQHASDRQNHFSLWQTSSKNNNIDVSLISLTRTTWLLKKKRLDRVSVWQHSSNIKI